MKMFVCGMLVDDTPWAEVVNLHGRDPKDVLKEIYFRQEIYSINFYTLKVSPEDCLSRLFFLYGERNVAQRRDDIAIRSYINR